jgi:hypothetical protein
MGMVFLLESTPADQEPTSSPRNPVNETAETSIAATTKADRCDLSFPWLPITFGRRSGIVNHIFVMA